MFCWKQGDGDGEEVPEEQEEAPRGKMKASGEEMRAEREAANGKKKASAEENRAQREAAKAAAAEQQKKRAELELLMLDESRLTSPPVKGEKGEQGAKKLGRKERLRLKKAARRRQREGGSDDEDLAAAGTAFHRPSRNPNKALCTPNALARVTRILLSSLSST